MQRTHLAVLAITVLGLVLSLVGAVASHAQDASDDASHAERATAAAPWITEDVEAGYALARETGKPLLITFR